MLSYDWEHRHFRVNQAPVELSPNDIEQMNSMEWWHGIPFAPGVRPRAFCQIPEEFIPLYFMDRVNFQGKSTLDIGCWDGFQSFYAESQGASRMVGLDDLGERHMSGHPREFAREKLGSKVQFVNCNLYDLSEQKFGNFDIVMMFGVLYHLKYPMLGVEKACAVCQDELLLSTHYRQTDTDIPLCILYPGTELDGDHTNWSGPNIPWIHSAIKLQGFEILNTHTYHGDRVTVHAKRINS